MAKELKERAKKNTIKDIRCRFFSLWQIRLFLAVETQDISFAASVVFSSALAGISPAHVAVAVAASVCPPAAAVEFSPSPPAAVVVVAAAAAVAFAVGTTTVLVLMHVSASFPPAHRDLNARPGLGRGGLLQPPAHPGRRGGLPQRDRHPGPGRPSPPRPRLPLRQQEDAEGVPGRHGLRRALRPDDQPGAHHAQGPGGRQGEGKSRARFHAIFCIRAFSFVKKKKGNIVSYPSSCFCKKNLDLFASWWSESREEK